MIASVAGPIFLQAFDSDHATKDAEFVTKLFMEVFEKIGDSNVVQIINDNASNYKATSALIENLSLFLVNSIKPKNSIWKKIMPQKNYEEAWG
ncbi:hypothetical protein AgCh_035811 [Apium graveolens]